MSGTNSSATEAEHGASSSTPSTSPSPSSSPSPAQSTNEELHSHSEQQPHQQQAQYHKKEKKEKKDKKDKDKGSSQSLSTRQVFPIEGGGLASPDGSYGDLVLVASLYEDSRDWTEIESLNKRNQQLVWIRARCSTVRGKGKFAFVVLRRGFSSVQCVVSDGVGGMNREGVKWCMHIPTESIIDVYGEVVPVQTPTHTSQPDVEIRVHKMFVVSVSSSTLPFQLADASRQLTDKEKAQAQLDSSSSNNNKDKSKEEENGGSSADGGVASSSGVSVDTPLISVGQDVRLDNRWLDLRTAANHAIFRVQSRVCQYYRQFLSDRDFIEIHTPKLTPGVSEGGAAVFRLSYFEREACLAQSPQLYKQMCVSSDLFRVFEIGPVFRAEMSLTHRHMCEFTGLDFEMEIKQHYHEVLKVLSELFVFIFDELAKNCKAELAAINAQYPFKPLRYNRETLVIPFHDAVKLLQKAGEQIGDEDDFSTPQEKKLGQLVSEKYNVDFYIVDQYPLSARPFYTMPNPANPRFTNSYDVFVRGEEITSGAQRVHDVELLRKRASECNIPESNIAAYLDSFRYGAWPHGGAGIGLERVVMLYLGLDNIRKATLFPRTPNRLTP